MNEADLPAARVARGAGVLLPATMLGSGLLLILDLYANSVLGTEVYGVYGAVRRVLGLASFVGLLGMENAVIRFVASAGVGGPGDAAPRASAAVRGAMATAFSGSTAVAVLLIAGSPWFADWIDPSGYTRWMLALGALSLPFAAVRMVAVSASQGWQVVWHRALVMFVAWPVVWFGLLALAAGWMGFGGVGAMGAYVGAMVVGALLATALLHRLAPRLWVERTLVPPRELLSFAWPVWVQGMLMAGYTWVDQVLLAGLGGAFAAGVYGPVAALAPLYGMALGALNGMFAPLIAGYHSRGELVELQRLYRTVTRWAVLLSMPPVVISLVAPEAVLSLWSHAAVGAVPALRITVLAQLGCTLVGSVNYLLIMSGHQRATLSNAAPALALNIAGCFYLIPRYGVTGAALANAIGMLTANGVAMAQVWSRLGVHPFHRALIRPFVAAIPAAAMFWVPAPGSELVALIVHSALSVAVYVIAVVGLGLDADDQGLLDTLARKFRR